MAGNSSCNPSFSLSNLATHSWSSVPPDMGAGIRFRAFWNSSGVSRIAVNCFLSSALRDPDLLFRPFAICLAQIEKGRDLRRAPQSFIFSSTLKFRISDLPGVTGHSHQTYFCHCLNHLHRNCTPWALDKVWSHVWPSVIHRSNQPRAGFVKAGPPHLEGFA